MRVSLIRRPGRRLLRIRAVLSKPTSARFRIVSCRHPAQNRPLLYCLNQQSYIDALAASTEGEPGAAAGRLSPNTIKISKPVAFVAY
jgi:hypothetical protein